MSRFSNAFGAIRRAVSGRSHNRRPAPSSSRTPAPSRSRAPAEGRPRSRQSQSDRRRGKKKKKRSWIQGAIHTVSERAISVVPRGARQGVRDFVRGVELSHSSAAAQGLVEGAVKDAVNAAKDAADEIEDTFKYILIAGGVAAVGALYLFTRPTTTRIVT